MFLITSQRHCDVHKTGQSSFKKVTPREPILLTKTIYRNRKSILLVFAKDIALPGAQVDRSSHTDTPYPSLRCHSSAQSYVKKRRLLRWYKRHPQRTAKLSQNIDAQILIGQLAQSGVRCYYRDVGTIKI